MKFPAVLLPTAYLPPVSYMMALIAAPSAVIERHEHFVKQTYRNRCIIGGAGGPLRLTIPLQRSGNERRPVHRVRISYATNWQRQHWRSIETAYRSAPFFEYYEEALKPALHTQEECLFAYNGQIRSCLLGLAGITRPVTYTESWERHPDGGVADLRSLPSPLPGITLHPYRQVFDNVHGFLPDLSFIDLLFNEGPSATSLDLLRKSM